MKSINQKHIWAANADAKHSSNKEAKTQKQKTHTKRSEEKKKKGNFSI